MYANLKHRERGSLRGIDERSPRGIPAAAIKPSALA
jgi:hypothetical protein